MLVNGDVTRAAVCEQLYLNKIVYNEQDYELIKENIITKIISPSKEVKFQTISR